MDVLSRLLEACWRPAGGGLDPTAPEELRSKESSQDGWREETSSSCQHDGGPVETERGGAGCGVSSPDHQPQLLPTNCSAHTRVRLHSPNAPQAERGETFAVHVRPQSCTSCASSTFIFPPFFSCPLHLSLSFALISSIFLSRFLLFISSFHHTSLYVLFY